MSPNKLVGSPVQCSSADSDGRCVKGDMMEAVLHPGKKVRATPHSIFLLTAVRKRKMYFAWRESVCTGTSCTGHQMITVLIDLAYAMLASYFWHKPPSSNSSGMVKILTGLSLDGSIEKMRELPAQEDYVILHLSALL